MADAAVKAQDYLKVAADRAEKEFALLSDTWKHIDTKAQATATIGGVFLAAAFSFVRNTALALSSQEKWLLCSVVGFLVASIVLAVMAMLVKPSSGPWSASVVTQMAEAAYGAAQRESAQEPNAVQERFVAVLADTLHDAAGANDRVRVELKVKSDQLANAQCCLVGAAASVVVLTLVAVFMKST